MAHVLMLCDTYAPMLGGSQKMLLDLARGLTARGHTVTVLTPTVRNGANFDSSEPYRIIRSRAWNGLFQAGASPRAFISRMARLLIVPLLFRQVLAIRNVDLLLVGHALPLGNVAAAVRRMRPGLKSIIMTYGEEVTIYARGARMRGMLIDAMRDANAVTCLTSDSAAEIDTLDAGFNRKTHVIPPAVTVPHREGQDSGELLRQTMDLGGKQVLLTLCRLTPRKGIDVTLRAVELLKDEFPNLVYLIIGHGQDVERLQNLAAQLRIEDKVRFIGTVEDSGAAYALADVFCMPNRQMPDGEREGFGIVFLEAGLAGKPVIGGRSGGAVDAIIHEQTGLLVNPQSSEDVAVAIRRLLTDPTLAARYGQAGRERALSEFSAQHFVESYFKLIASIIQDEPSKQ